MVTAEELIARLGLTPHPSEGGFYVETYRSDEQIEAAGLPERYGAPRALGTAIYYLLTPTHVSAMHRLQSDEIFHFYLGDPVEMLLLHPDGSGKVVILGAGVQEGIRPQITVPRGVWQGAHLAGGGRLALLGTTVAPGFDFADFEIGSREELLRAYPQFADLTTALTQ
jgi:predicted cupin superfamily sugar epimerase